jgi:hypothetical protein
VLGSRASRSAGPLHSAGTPPDDGAEPRRDPDNGLPHNVCFLSIVFLSFSGAAAAAAAAAAGGPSNRAMEVIDRIQKKLIGQDFGSEILDTKSQVCVCVLFFFFLVSEEVCQVGRLIEEATSETNLAMLFHGWCRSGRVNKSFGFSLFFYSCKSPLFWFVFVSQFCFSCKFLFCL